MTDTACNFPFIILSRSIRFTSPPSLLTRDTITRTHIAFTPSPSCRWLVLDPVYGHALLMSVEFISFHISDQQRLLLYTRLLSGTSKTSSGHLHRTHVVVIAPTRGYVLDFFLFSRVLPYQACYANPSPYHVCKLLPCLSMYEELLVGLAYHRHTRFLIVLSTPMMRKLGKSQRSNIQAQDCFVQTFLEEERCVQCHVRV